MSRDDIIRMAREAGLTSRSWEPDAEDEPVLRELERFAALVAAHERELCAKVCDVDQGVEDWEIQCGAEGRQLCKDLAAAIRARGTT